ncbi:MAG: glycosyltransferase family 4 protein [Actinobacteria bacterium]|nr:glycosyltransferase family 4 protein [Actinomycetota bacterium]
MRIALTHAYSWPEVRRGAERILRDLSTALAARGHDVTVHSAGSRSSDDITDGVRTIRMRRRFASANRHEQDFALRLLPRLAAGSFDAVHSFGPRDAVASIHAARLHRRRRTVYTNLGLPFRWAWDPRLDGKAHRRVVRDIDVYGCMSQFALDALKADYGRQGALTPGGVDLQRFQPGAPRTPTPTVLFSGAMNERRKGAATLLEALSLLVKDGHAVRVRLSGPGDARPLLENAPEAARAHVDVLPIGDPDDQTERYATSWVTALPSQNDSFGMVLVESLACGTPVVASNHAALPELVTPGVTGTLCEPEDPASLAAALAAGLDLARRPGTTAACRASAAPFDWVTSVAPAMEALYRG